MPDHIDLQPHEWRSDRHKPFVLGLIGVAAVVAVIAFHVTLFTWLGSLIAAALR